jgi:hypothetical protein
MKRVPKSFYHRIFGVPSMPHTFARVQTDGSYYTRNKLSRIAMILYPSMSKVTQKQMLQIMDVNDSTETEWASVSQGLVFALEHDETIINIENDNLSVVSALIMPQNNLKRDYAKYYRNTILSNARETEWTGIRWIPRGMNLADKLFR